MSGNPDGPKHDVLDDLNDPKLLRRLWILAIVVAGVASMLYLLWYWQ